MKHYSILTKFTAQTSHRDQLATVLLEAAHSMKQIKDCYIYTVNIDENEPHTIYVYETWHSEAAHRASLTLEHTQNLINQAKPILSGIERLYSHHSLGGKGINTPAAE